MNSTNSLAIFTKASLMLAEANTIQKAKELKNLALTAADWAKRKNMGEEAVQYCRSYALEAERKMGEMLKSTERAKGGQPHQKNPTSNHREPVEPTLADLGISKKESSKAQMLAELATPVFDAVKAGRQTVSSALRAQKTVKVKESLNKISAIETKKSSGVFDVIVVDPPWPIEKVERDCRPNQVRYLDYPIMSLEDISKIRIPAADNCHLFLWTTQRFLRDAFVILDAWGAAHCCTFVWHKPGGFQVVGLPQFNCEFCLHGRLGKPVFVDTKNFFTCFDAARGSHSEKPEDFYATVRRVTAGRRLDMFNRRPIEGFETEGNQAK